MSNAHDNVLPRVPCVVGSSDQEARLCWRDGSMTVDEICDVEAAKARFLIAYGWVPFCLWCKIRLTKVLYSSFLSKADLADTITMDGQQTDSQALNIAATFKSDKMFEKSEQTLLFHGIVSVHPV
jgi:hypothetical protein